MIENLMVDSVTVYLAPTFAEDASGGPNISALGTGTTSIAHVGISSANLVTDDEQEGQRRLWDVMVLANSVLTVLQSITPNMTAIVLIASVGGVPLNKYARVLCYETIGGYGGAIEPYHVMTCEEFSETS